MCVCVCERLQLLTAQGLQFKIHHDSLYLWEEERENECVYGYLGEEKSLLHNKSFSYGDYLCNDIYYRLYVLQYTLIVTYYNIQSMLNS